MYSNKNNKKKELNMKIKDMDWAQKASKKLREKSEGFYNGKKGSKKRI